MPRKCSVPECNSNYKGTEYTSCFSYPKDETNRQKWLQAIHREDYVPTAESVICIKHFEQRFIITEEKVRRDDGSWLCVQRKVPKLSPDAYPTISLNQPSHIPTTTSSKHKTPAKRLCKQSKSAKEEFQMFLKNDKIESFDHFKELFTDKLPKGWFKVVRSESVILFQCDFTEMPEITLSLKVHPDLTISVYNKNILVKSSRFIWLLGKAIKCDLWSKFECLVSHLHSLINEDLKIDTKAAISENSEPNFDPEIGIKDEVVDIDENHLPSTSKTSDELIIPREPADTPSTPALGVVFTVCNTDNDDQEDTVKNTSNGKSTNTPTKESKKKTSKAKQTKKRPCDERPRDNFDTYGDYIADKLKKLDWKSCAYVQKTIGDIIYEAEMGKCK